MRDEQAGSAVLGGGQHPFPEPVVGQGGEGKGHVVGAFQESGAVFPGDVRVGRFHHQLRFPLPEVRQIRQHQMFGQGFQPAPGAVVDEGRFQPQFRPVGHLPVQVGADSPVSDDSHPHRHPGGPGASSGGYPGRGPSAAKLRSTLSVILDTLFW